MTKYESHYKEMRFYVEGRAYKFSNGVFNTDDKQVQAALEKTQYVRKIEEAKPVEHAEEPKEPTKATTKRKTAAKAKAE